MSGFSGKKILVVDSSKKVLEIIHRILEADYEVYVYQSEADALIVLATMTPDLILMDIEMALENDYQFLNVLKANCKQTPIIFLTTFENQDSDVQALTLGAVDYVMKPIVASVLKSRVHLHLEVVIYRQSLEALVEAKTTQLVKTQDAILNILSNVTSFRDNETGSHILRTCEYTRLIIDALQRSNNPLYYIDEKYALDIIKSAKLHDIGKVAIPDHVLLKPTRLTKTEFDMIKMHTTLGAAMIENAMNNLGNVSSFLKTADELVMTHHERWDGTGYPGGLSGYDIPLSGRIMAIADVYDALISARPYKKAFTHDEALNIIREGSGTHFDKTIIEICEDIFPQFQIIAELIPDVEEYIL